jgi:hypothetical protein
MVSPPRFRRLKLRRFGDWQENKGSTVHSYLADHRQSEPCAKWVALWIKG